MATQSAQPSSASITQSEMDCALDQINTAIALVASGGARRVTLVLPHAEFVLAAARVAARGHGVVADAAWGTGGGCDIVISPVA